MENVSNFLQNLLENIANYLPTVLGALLVLIIGFIVAGVIKRLLKRGLGKANLNSYTSRKGGVDMDLENLLSKLVYYIILVIVLLITLSILDVEGVMEPIENMVNKFLSFIPNLIAAAIIGFAGYILAKIFSELAGAFVMSIEALSNRLGLSGDTSLDKVVEKVVFLLVFIPVLIVALDALQISAISEPATNMLDTFLAAIPNILAGAVILIVFYIIAKFLTPVFVDLLKSADVDKYPEKLRFSRVLGQKNSLSEISGRLLFFFIMFFGLISALDKTGLNDISNMLGELLELSAQIVLGLIIIAIGNFLANIAYRSIVNSAEGKTVANIAKYTVLGLFIAIALDTMGIADDIVNLAFGLTLGAAAVAFALSFGLGGREAAGKQMEHFLSSFRSGEKSSGPGTQSGRNNPGDL